MDQTTNKIKDPHLPCAKVPEQLCLSVNSEVDLVLQKSSSELRWTHCSLAGLGAVIFAGVQTSGLFAYPAKWTPYSWPRLAVLGTPGCILERGCHLEVPMGNHNNESSKIT